MSSAIDAPSESAPNSKDRGLGVLEGLDLYRRLIGAQIRSLMQYRISFAFDFISTGLITLVECAAVAIVFQRFDSLGCWSLGEVALLYGTVTVAFKTMEMLFVGFDPSGFGESVRLGGFDRIMLLPAGLTLQVLGSRFALHRIGALYIIGSTITFWTIDSIEAINIFTYGGQEMMSVPMHIYHPLMRRFFTFVVPGVFLNYAPVVHLLGREDQIGLGPTAPYLAPFVGLIAMIGALAFWRFGVRHYQSTGT